MRPLFVTVPHAGETVPAELTWLKGLPEPVLMCDIDRYVDEIYSLGIKHLGLPWIVADIHRYVVDLNRAPTDIDQDSVEGSANPPGMFPIGFHWSQTTTGTRLMKSPISQIFHDELTKKYYEPFHSQVREQFAQFKKSGIQNVYHLDAHSMPSKGTSAHRDPGTRRAQIVVSDRDGVSCDPKFKDLVIRSYEKSGFEVAYNWPYKGGRITEVYGQPKLGQHTVQVEMNRNLYMDEITKARKPEEIANVQKQVTQALAYVYEGISEF